MRFRMANIMAIAILMCAPLCSGADDPGLSAGFLRPAGDYLQVVHDCSIRKLAAPKATCDVQDVSAKAEGAATTSGDKAVLGNLDAWFMDIVLYSIMVQAEDDPATRAKDHSAMQQVSDVCSAEIGKALQDKVAPEKSQCHDLLNKT